MNILCSSIRAYGLLIAWLAAFFLPFSGESKCLGKIEVAPAYIHVDVINFGETVKKLDMGGIRGDASLVSANGWAIKPTAMYGRGKDGEITAYSCAVGRCIPVTKKLIATPLAGISYTRLNTTFWFDIPSVGKIAYKEEFTGYAPYIGLDLIYSFAPSWRICANVQYGWSYSDTNIRSLLSAKADSSGPSYGLLLEYDITPCWSINAGVAYNETFSRDKNGIRGRGGKIGIVRWF